MDTIDHNAMLDADELVSQYAWRIPLMHTVTIILNDGSPEVTMQGFTNDSLDEHLTITVWKGHTVYKTGLPS